MDVYINSKKVVLRATKLMGRGGEADVYDIGGGKVVKVFKGPSHADFKGKPLEQQAARARIDEHQNKLPDFPKGLPSEVVSPQDLAKSQGGKKVLGYTMQFLKDADLLRRYSEKSFRQQGVNNADVISVFQNMYKTVQAIHQAGVVLGDFNDLNIMVRKGTPFFIDADSFQFGHYLCRVYTEKLVDPLLCDSGESRPALIQPHTMDSDWYAFTSMLMECLLYVGPYGGIYKPKDKSKRLKHAERPLHRVTVFNPETKYPKPARRYDVLSDDFLDYLQRVFEKDERGVFPQKLLNMNWTVCNCGCEHARSLCPECAHQAPAAVIETVVVRGKVKCGTRFKTKGTILFAAYQKGALRWLYHENRAFKRDQGKEILKSDLSPGMRYRIHGDATIIGRGDKIVTINPPALNHSENIEAYRNQIPIFDANGDHYYWVSNGRLMRDGDYVSLHMGDVLSQQTIFWVGPKFGFGFYRASELTIGFVFDAMKKGINDSVKIEPIRGQLVKARTVFTDKLVWFLTSTSEATKTVNRCTVINKDGKIMASTEAEDGGDTWLGSVTGKCAISDFLLSATDDGLVRVEMQGDQLVESKTFPDTEPFADSSCHLFPAKEGIFVVDSKEIRLLQIG